MQTTVLPSGLRRFFRIPLLVGLLCFCRPAGLSGQGDPASARPGGTDPSPTLHAIRTPDPIRVDGVLDEAVWLEAPAVSGFRQRWPVDGSPATERTEVRVAYDDRAIYFGMVMFDDSEPDRIMRSHPPPRGTHRQGRCDHHRPGYLPRPPKRIHLRVESPRHPGRCPLHQRTAGLPRRLDVGRCLRKRRPDHRPRVGVGGGHPPHDHPIRSSQCGHHGGGVLSVHPEEERGGDLASHSPGLHRTMQTEEWTRPPGSGRSSGSRD